MRKYPHLPTTPSPWCAGDFHLAFFDDDGGGACPLILISTRGTFHQRAVEDGCRKLLRRHVENQAADIVQRDGDAIERGQIGDALGPRDAARVDEVGLELIDCLVLQKGQRIFGQLDVFASHNRQPGRAPQRHPCLGKVGCQRVFVKERLDRLHRLGDADGAGHIQFVVAVDNDVDLVAECFAGEDVGTLNLARIFGADAGVELLHGDAQHGVDVHLECLKTVRIILELLRSIPPFGFAQKVAAVVGAVRIELDFVAEVAAE